MARAAVVALLSLGLVAFALSTEVEEPWNSANHPSRLHLDGLVVHYDTIVKNQWTIGRSSKAAWPSYYWATYKDGPNYRWHQKKNAMGEVIRDLSPLEKYDLAFNGWGADWNGEQWTAFRKLKPFDPDHCVEDYYKSPDAAYYTLLGPAAKWYSDNAGNLKARNGKDDDGDGKIDECDDIDGVQKWEGLCHAWCPASILEPEPDQTVKINGVEFFVSDIKALLMLEYDRTNAYSVGSRCNLKKDDLKTDQWDRFERRECRDTNAGAMHVSLANLLGNHKRPLVVDRTRDFEVWNQPVIGFTSIPIEEFNNPQAACVWLGHSSEQCASTPFSITAVRFVAVKTEMDWVTESTPSDEPQIPNLTWFLRKEVYYYIVEIDVDGNIVGGEYHKESRAPDFFWLPTSISKAKATGKNPKVDRSTVFNLLSLSRKNDVVEEFNWNQGGADIPDYAPDGVRSEIEIARPMLAESVLVSVEIEHGYTGDLRLSLIHNGMEVVLKQNDNKTGKVIKSVFNVESLKGTQAKGVWTLLVRDMAKEDAGKLVKWSVKVRGVPAHENVVNEELVPSGLWTGYFVQEGYMFNVDMSLRFEKSKVSGDGKDSVGVYSVEGTFTKRAGDEQAFDVEFKKSYNGAHVVAYQGTYTAANNLLKGEWTVVTEATETAEPRKMSGQFQFRPNLYA